MRSFINGLTIKVGNYIYLFGGGSTKIEKFDLETETFVAFNYYLPSDVNKNHGITKDDNGNIYIIGNVSYKFDTNTNEVTTFKSLNVQTGYNYNLFHLNNKLYSVSYLSYNNTVVEMIDLDVVENGWNQLDRITATDLTSYPSWYSESDDMAVIFPVCQDTSSAGHRVKGLSFRPGIKGEIRYTLDGTEPTKNSLLYTSPITISENTKIKAKGFKIT